MTTDTSIFGYIINAGFVVRCVMLILFFASIASWTVITERFRYYKRQWQETKQFEQRFWSGVSLKELYEQSSMQKITGLGSIFTSGFKAFSQFQATGHHSRDDIIIGAQRAMQIAESNVLDELERPLPLLATIGSVSPFIGLFGTVWGIMTAFQALATVQQASIAMVAPGLSEALITTAIGLFTAIPAAIAYNRFGHQVARLQNHFDNFSAELTNILHRQTLITKDSLKKVTDEVHA